MLVRAGAVGAVVIALVASCSSGSGGDTNVDPAARSQAWTHVPGTCGPEVQGAVFSRSKEGCGGSGTPFDDDQVYVPAVVVDEARAEAPCPGLAEGSPCYRMWYVGNDADERRRIGYATSPDGISWTRVPGGATDASILDPGAAGAFDSDGQSAPTVIKDGEVFKLWYTGLGPKDRIQGVGLATSIDGATWTRVPGPAEGGAVLRESGEKGSFDRNQVITATVLKDNESTGAPCVGASPGGACYRMWYEGIDTSNGYVYRVGYATSPDGVAWTKVPGSDPTGAVLGLGAKGAFDDAGVGVPNVVKDGALYRMWYEAFAKPSYTIGYATSPDGLRWTRASEQAPALRGADDPGTFDPDDVWTATVVRTGTTYDLWYTVSSKPDSARLGLARLTPGTPLGDVSLSADGTLRFTTATAIPAGGSVLVATGGLDVEAVGAIEGFGPGATAAVEPGALTDALAQGVARPAVVVRLVEGAPAGPKQIGLRFGPVTDGTAASLVVQTFDTTEALERGEVTVG